MRPQQTGQFFESCSYKGKIKMNRYQIELLNESKQCWIVSDLAYLGRDLDCKIQLVDELVDARHSRLEIRGKELVIKDMRSTNGTYVNGALIIEATLKDGDLITIGA